MEPLSATNVAVRQAAVEGRMEHRNCVHSKAVKGDSFCIALNGNCHMVHINDAYGVQVGAHLGRLHMHMYMAFVTCRRCAYGKNVRTVSAS